MQTNKYLLKSSVIAEPLINNWYAWSYLVAPATCALFTVNRQLKIMNSYVQNPKLHADAAKIPQLKGGAFLDTENNTDNINNVKELIKNIIKTNPSIIDFSTSIKELEKLLAKADLNGMSLECLYNDISPILRGYVELVYDLSNQPSFRFIERLLYKSELYNEANQSVMLSQASNKTRSFVLSTPRFADDCSILIKKPFKYKLYDQLFEMRFTPKAQDEIVSFYNRYLNNYDKNLFLSFFEEYVENKNINKKAESLLQIKYYGHACVLIETNELNILIDPLISYGYDNENPHYSYKDLPHNIDYVMISHGHLDHLALETLIQIRHKIKNIIVPRNNPGVLQDPSLALILQNCGFKNIIEIDELEEIKIPDGCITGIPFFGEHGDLNIHAKTTYLVGLNGKNLYFAVDSNNLNPDVYAKVSKLIPCEIDAIFIGMECSGAPISWLYGALYSNPVPKVINQSRRLSGSDCNKAIQLIEQFRCKKVFIYAMGLEPWLNFISSIDYSDESYSIIESNKLLEYCKKTGIFAKRLFWQYDMTL